MAERYQVTVDVHVILERGDQILLCLREGTGYADGLYCLPSGHLESGESVVECALREVREEVGVTIVPADLRPATVIHHLSPEESPRIGVFFAADAWGGEVMNAEPHKCGRIDWVPADHLPGNTVPYTAAGISAYLRGAGIDVHGWPELAAPR